MIRLIAILSFAAFLITCAFRNWYISLCGLILMTSISQHRDMPTNVAGIPGLNPWNAVLLAIVVAYFVHPPPARQPLPRGLSMLLWAYVAMLVISAARAMLDMGPLLRLGYTTKDVALDLLINPLKYLVVGYLFYMGAQTRRDVLIGIVTILIFTLLHALLMYKAMKENVFFGSYDDARRLTRKLIGVHAVDLGGLLAMGSWAWIVAAAHCRGYQRWLSAGAAVLIMGGMWGCHSRAAFIAFGVTGLMFAAIRWRWLLVVVPVAAVVAVAAIPDVGEKIFVDFQIGFSDDSDETDWNAVTAGRTSNIWKPAIEQALHSPLIGYGRLAILREDCYYPILEHARVVPTHPHNSYLELFLDQGVLGLAPALTLLCWLGLAAFRQFRSTVDGITKLVGGIGLAAILSVATLALSSQFLYPKESMQWLTCTVALVLRQGMIGQMSMPDVTFRKSVGGRR